MLSSQGVPSRPMLQTPLFAQLPFWFTPFRKHELDPGTGLRRSSCSAYYGILNDIAVRGADNLSEMTA